MVVGGVGFGLAVTRAGVLPRWTGCTLALGVVLVAVASGSGNLERALASAVPDVAFIAMGVHLLHRRSVLLTRDEADGAFTHGRRGPSWTGSAPADRGGGPALRDAPDRVPAGDLRP